MILREHLLYIGIGQCGGNIGDEFQKQNIQTICVNSSLRDLDTLKYVNQKLHLKDGAGANHNRKKSKQLFIKELPTFLNTIGEKVRQHDIKIILVGYSSAGGTGSGIGNIASELIKKKYPNIVVCMVSVLPSDLETIKAHYNSYLCFQELMQNKICGATFILDNNSFEDKLEINREFVENFCNLIDIPQCDSSQLKRIDENEILEVLSAKNMAIITSIPYIENQNIIDSLLKSLNDNVYAPREEDNKLGYLLLSLADRNLSFEKTLADLQLSIGKPIDAYITSNTRKKTIICLTGLKMPEERINKIKNVIEGNSKIIEETLNNNISITNISDDLSNLLDTPNLDLPINNNLTNDTNDNNFEDLISKYL